MLVLLRFKQDNIPHTCTCSYIKYIFFILAKKTSTVAANYNDELVGTILSSVLNEIISDSESEHEVDTASITPHFLPKTPKTSFPPRKCINVHCKEEKESLKETIYSLRKEINECKCRLLLILFFWIHKITDLVGLITNKTFS